MPPRPPDPPELHVHTSDDVERMVRQGTLADQTSQPNARPAPKSSLPASPPLDYATQKGQRNGTPVPSRKAVRLTRLALLIAYPSLALLAIAALPAAHNAASLIVVFLLMMMAPALLGTMLIACCFQFYLLGLFERKGMLARWNIPLSVLLGPVAALILVRLLVPLMLMIGGKM